MNPHIANFFRNVEGKLPRHDLIKSQDLVNAGIVKSTTTLARWRNCGYGPTFLRISKGQVRYLKAAVIEWLKTTYKTNLSSSQPTTNYQKGKKNA